MQPAAFRVSGRRQLPRSGVFSHVNDLHLGRVVAEKYDKAMKRTKSPPSRPQSGRNSRGGRSMTIESRPAAIKLNSCGRQPTWRIHVQADGTDECHMAIWREELSPSVRPDQSMDKMLGKRRRAGEPESCQYSCRNEGMIYDWLHQRGGKKILGGRSSRRRPAIFSITN